jgi:replicative DNA helicase
MTYDLSVPHHHTFVANDIITHNTVFAINWCYNLVTRYRTNVFYCSFEMPYEQLRRLILVRHSAHPRFILQDKKPLDYRKVRDGELTSEEEAFYKEVLQDWDENPEYCRFHIWCPDRDVSITDVRIEAELLHKQLEVGFVVFDHGGLMEASRKHRDYTIELNSVLRDAKKLALYFNHGEGIPVLMLFQINRDGKDAADKAEGKYKIRALSYANECLAEGTLVRTSGGLVPIERVQPGELVYSSTGWKVVQYRFEQGIRRTVKVTTTEGVEVICTPNHLFQTIGEDGLEWVEAKDTEGRYVLSDQPHDKTMWPIGPLCLGLYERYKARGRFPGKWTFASNQHVTQAAIEAFLGCLDSDAMRRDADVILLQRLLLCRPQLVGSVRPWQEVPVFDLEVSGDHEYSTGGILTHNCERSADTVTTTYLNDNHRDNGTTMCCCLKNRDNPLFKPFLIGVDFSCRRIYRLSPDSLSGSDMGTDSQDDMMNSIMSL